MVNVLQGEAPPEITKALKNVYSQFGEDGILQELFSRIGTTNKQCFEVGAADGKWFSNSRRLIDGGWKACLIEADESNWPELMKLDGVNGSTVVQGKAEPTGPASLDSILDQCEFSSRPDLGVIDVDGQDYYLWNGMVTHLPRVMVVEYDPLAKEAFIPDLDGEGQAGLAAIMSISVSKGYFNVARTRTNLIFALNSEKDKFYAEKNAKRVLQPDEYYPHPTSDRDWKNLPYRVSPTNERVLQVAKPADSVLQSPAPVTPPCPVLATGVEREIKICAVLSRPRYGTNTFWDCANEALAPWKIPIQSFYGVFWGQCMQTAMEQNIEKGVDWILTLDYDSMFTSQHVDMLINCLGQHPEIDAVAPLQCRRGRPLPLMVRSDGQAQMTGGPVQAATAHFGLTLFRTESIAKMKKPWFWSTPTPGGGWGDGRLDDDIYFWHQWREAGNTLFVHTGCRIGHIEEMVSQYDEKYEQKHTYLTKWREENGFKVKAYD